MIDCKFTNHIDINVLNEKYGLKKSIRTLFRLTEFGSTSTDTLAKQTTGGKRSAKKNSVSEL